MIVKSDCYFDECKDCINNQYNDDLFCCAASRLSLAWYRLFKEIPIINRFIVDNKYCNWYQKDTTVKEQPTRWTLGYSLDAELGFRDGKYLLRKAALILYPEYFDENGEPNFNMLPIGRSNEVNKNELS